MLPKRLSKGLQGLITKHPKIVLAAMMLILIFGIAMIFVKRQSIRNTSRIDKIGNVVRSLPQNDSVIFREKFFDDVTNVMQMNKHLDEIEEILQMEEEVKKVLNKQVLTREDSLFLNEVNKKLNKLNYEN